MRIRIQDLIELQIAFGNDATLSAIIDEVKGSRIHLCPQCNGTGRARGKKTIPYPSGLPDSGWVPDKVVDTEIDCSLCHGFGFNDRPYKPRMIQDGWE